MSSKTSTNTNKSEATIAQEKLDQLLHDQVAWVGEVGKSLERSEDHIKQRMQYFDRLAVLSGAILAFSVPAFTTFRGSGHSITHSYTSLGFAIGGWAFLFLAMAGAAITHFLLVELYAIWTSDHERAVQSVLFNNLNLLQRRLMRSAGGDQDALNIVPVPVLSFRRKPWHENLAVLLPASSRTSIAACLVGTLCIFLFLIFSSY